MVFVGVCTAVAGHGPGAAATWRSLCRAERPLDLQPEPLEKPVKITQSICLPLLIGFIVIFAREKNSVLSGTKIWIKCKRIH